MQTTISGQLSILFQGLLHYSKGVFYVIHFTLCIFYFVRHINRGPKHADELIAATKIAIQQQQDIVTQASGMLRNHSVVLAGNFRYAILGESTLLPRFLHPLALMRLAHFLLDTINVCFNFKNLNAQ